MAMEDRYEVAATASHIIGRGYTRIALQFPDELLKYSVEIKNALVRSCGPSVRFFVMADTTFGSCCVDEVSAAHVDADCVVHYGRACLSPVSRLPVWFVFGKTPLNVQKCALALADVAESSDQPLLVLYDLEYAHAIPELQVQVKDKCSSSITFAQIVGREMSPCGDYEDKTRDEKYHVIAGLRWESLNMDSHKIMWIGKETSALTSVMLTYNSVATVRYDPDTDSIINTTEQSAAILRRYYLIERAKDAEIVGIVAGTLGVAGYRQAIQNIKQMVKTAGKKSYTLAVGKPNHAKLANFPECDVFVLVACPQTALVDSKEYFAPVITPFEAELAFVRGSQWTGFYCLDFRKLGSDVEFDDVSDLREEPNFSFFKGGYVSSRNRPDGESGDIIPARSSEVIPATDREPDRKRASDFFVERSFQGLQLYNSAGENQGNYAAVTGQKGRAAMYEHEHTS